MSFGTLNARGQRRRTLPLLVGFGLALGAASWPAAAQVMISEFMADNSAGLKDNDGDRSDWIELLNTGDEAVDLSGWFLTDDRANLTKWRLPQWTIGRNGYLLVWASEKDRTSHAAGFHTNFKLAAGGEYLALINRETNIVSEFAPAYPPQAPNVSYGRDRLEPALTGYFSLPTPGGANASTGVGFAPEPVISQSGGVFTNASLSVSISALGGVIRYTVDGTPPTESSLAYTAPLTFTVSTVLQARVFRSGLLPSAVVAETYTFLDSSAAGFSSNLPVLLVYTSGRGISQDLRTRAFISAFEPHVGRSRLSDRPDFQSAAQIEGRGQTSSSFPKQPYNLETQDAYGNDRPAALLGLPSESDWVLHNPYSDKCLMNNFLAFELHRKMGHYAPRCQFVEVFVKTSRGRVSYPADYRGVYVLMEKIKIDAHRVDLTPLTPADDREPEITGGYIIKKDKDSPGDLNFYTAGGGTFSGQALKYHEPKPREITGAQQSWIRQFLVQFERCLYANDWLRRTGTNHYSNYIDVDSFIDYHWIVEFTKQIDGYRLSNYLTKDRGGKLKMEPIWDWNLAWGNADYLDGWNTNGWYYPLVGENDHPWLRRLISGTVNGLEKRGDPDFNQRIADRWSVLRTNILDVTNVLQRVDEIASLLDEAQARDFAKYPRLNTYVWPNPAFYVTSTYQGIIQSMKRWIRGRYAWIDTQFVKPPRFYPVGELGAPGFSIGLSAPAGTVYFTVDGTDPRLSGGALNPVAQTHTGQLLMVDRNMRVFARARSGTNWSGPMAETFIVSPPPLAFTEIMYHPAAAPPGDTNLAEAFEFIELKNVSGADLSLTGLRFTRGIEFTFTNTTPPVILLPGEQVLLVKNRLAFAARYPGALARVLGQYEGSLDNSGERLTLEGPLLEPLQDFTYSNGWLPSTDGLGFSLVPVDEVAPFSVWNDSSQWRASHALGGSPGQNDPAPASIPAIRVNEVLSRPSPGQADAIELFNPTAALAEIGGWYLTDELQEPRKFRIPPGRVIQPGGFAVFTETDFGGAGQAGFGINAEGDRVYLLSSDGDQLTGYAQERSFGAAPLGVTFGNHLLRAGEERFVAQSENTLGAPNSGPLVGPVVINEILFAPATAFADGGDEYVELSNLTAEPVRLGTAGQTTNAWRLRGVANFSFPASASLAPGGMALVVNFDPAQGSALERFRSLYQVNPSVPVFGPYSGRLDDQGERLSLWRPDLRETIADAAHSVVFIEVDAVRYSPLPPWPGETVGTGKSLQRVDATEFGDDPANWLALVATPGSPNLPVGSDSDADGLPDDWELIHFGQLTAAPADDPDQDNATNLQEYVAGTNPLAAASALRLECVRAPGGKLQLWFSMAPDRAYSVQATEELGSAWKELKSFPAQSSAGEGTLWIDESASGRFYRLVVSRP